MPSNGCGSALGALPNCDRLVSAHRSAARLPPRRGPSLIANSERLVYADIDGNSAEAKKDERRGAAEIRFEKSLLGAISSGESVAFI